jgi:hypothetical protein
MLIVIFLLGLTIQIALVILSYSESAIAYNDLVSLLTKLLAVYSIHLSVIFGGIFAQKRETRKRSKPIQLSKAAFGLALVLALIWNLLLLWRSIMFGMAVYDVNREDSVGQFLSYIETIASASSFLVAGALAYFFTHRE